METFTKLFGSLLVFEYYCFGCGSHAYTLAMLQAAISC
jgi:hypothetical protein